MSQKTSDEVLPHILEVTDARPCGPDRWMGHGICHGSKRSRDLSIRNTGSLILLHDFTGCPLSAICSALGIRVADLFLNTSHSHVSHSTPKRSRPDRLKTAFVFEFHAMALKERAEATWNAASGLDCRMWVDRDFDAAVDAVGRAFDNLAHAENLFGVVEQLRERAFAEKQLQRNKKEN